jgi:inosine-uridine nucleoside N-ribohydrolase
MTADATLVSDFERRSPVWIDTDAACGHRATADPDDCFALLVLVGASELAVVGVSTVFGNAPLEDSDRITRRVLEEWRGDALPPAVFQGLAHPFDESSLETMPEGVLALRDALSKGPLRIVALGPLTNIAAAIRGRLTLARNIVEVIAVMGKREGHLFHPSEGARVNLLFGHGPIFRDLNFARDVSAVRTLMNSGVRITLLPYELARQVSLTGEDLARFERAGGSLAWVARSSRGWLGYWRTVVGRDGFYPFDLLAAAYAIDDRHLRCGLEFARVGTDRKVGPLFRSASLLVGAPDSDEDRTPSSAVEVNYCTVAHATLRPWLLARLVSSSER